MEKSTKKKKKRVLVIIIFILIGLILIKNHNSKNEYATLDIPQINLSKKIYDKDSKNNNVEKGILLLNESTNLEEDNSKIILAAHSGSSHVSYFDNLDKLSLNDEISIKRNNKTYYYKIIDKHKEDKDGDIEFSDYNEGYIVLTTCDQDDKTKQIVVVGILTGNIEIT